MQIEKYVRTGMRSPGAAHDNTKCVTKNLGYPASTILAGKTGSSNGHAGPLVPGAGFCWPKGVTAALLARLLASDISQLG